MINKINRLLELKSARYITRQLIVKTYGKQFYESILDRTKYLPETTKLSERLYHILHNITSPQMCPHCGNIITTPLKTFNMSVNEYFNRFCSKSCQAAYIYDMKSNHKDIYYDKEYILKQIREISFIKLKRNILFMDQVKAYIYSICGYEYKRMTPTEALYFIKNSLTELPRCPITNNYVTYLHKGKYRQHDSCKSSANNPTTISTRKQTVNKQYGVDNISQSDQTKQKIRQTMLNRYGIDHYCKTNEYKLRIKTKDITNKMSEEGKERVRQHNYKRAWNRILSFSDIVKPLFSFEEYHGCGFDKQYKWLCVKTGKEFYGWYHQALIPKSPYIYDGSDIETFIKSFLVKNNIPFQKNTKSIIDPFELDFYLPEHNIAIECNGLYWHSESNGKDKNYHLNKTNLCKEKGITLIHIFSDEIFNKPKVVISKLSSILNINKYKIYARKCEIKEISSKLKGKFLTKYHTQGNDNSSINLGLFYKNKLVSVMTFGKKRLALGHKHKNNEYELLRFCNNYRFVIIGGASKLLKYFERNYNPSKIITYADKRWSTGGVYFKLGFTHTHDSKPNYWYTKNYIDRFHRFNFRKSELFKKIKNYDSTLTERENMLRDGWVRIWDCGTMVFEKVY